MTERRDVHATMTLDAAEATSYMLAVSAAAGVPLLREELTVTLDGEPVAVRELLEPATTRLQLFRTGRGRVEIDYRASVEGRAAPAPVAPLEEIVYLRPSRYVESDALQPFARETFGGSSGADLVRRVTAWVHERLRYDAGETSPTGGAAQTLEAGAGVCRDFAHLTAALLRALDVPARLVSVYAPQLSPPDFHAVVEVLVDGRWVVADATRLAPRRGMIRVATGRDAADTAFLTNTLADIRLTALSVEALADPVLAEDDPDELVELG
ncbi:MAG TPA: transglutaminase family protein [Pseudolysinimonas sp.]|nr:transglutaminase family protein [Pseudolysinimonas sp.]